MVAKLIKLMQKCHLCENHARCYYRLSLLQEIYSEQNRCYIIGFF